MEPLTVTVDIPDEFALQAWPTDTNPSRAALEAIALEGYRSRRLTESQVQRLLGYPTRMEVHTFLMDHRVELNYTVQEMEQDLAAASFTVQQYHARNR